MSTIKSDKLPPVSPVTRIRRYQDEDTNRRHDRDHRDHRNPASDSATDDRTTIIGDDGAQRPGAIDEYV